MTPTEQLAARWLADVRRYDRNGRHMELDPQGPWLHEAEVLAAIARHLAPGDDLVERCAAMQAAHDSENIMEAIEKIADLPDRIAALTAQFEATQESHLHSDSLRLKAQAEAATLRARLARIEKAADRIANWTIGGKIADDPENLAKYPLLAWAILDLRAALTDGGNNG